MFCVSREQISLGELWNLLSPSTESLDLALRIKALSTFTRLFVGVGCSPHTDTSDSLQEHTGTRPLLPTAAAALSCSGMAIPRLSMAN